MPELPEVETVRAGLARSIEGKRVRTVHLHRKTLRTPITPGFAKRVEGKRIVAVRRRAKYLLMDLDNGEVILAHLGMTGKMLIQNGEPETRHIHDHVQFAFDDGLWLTFNDARRFGMLAVLSPNQLRDHPGLTALGPEPLESAFNAKYLASQLARRTGPLKVALMDQVLVVGVGNIYASEALFRSKLSPKLSAREAMPFAASLVRSIRAVLKAAIRSGGSTLRDYVRSSGEVGGFQHHFNVYERAGKPCPACGTAIERIRQAGRSTYYCPDCQPLPHTDTKR